MTATLPSDAFVFPVAEELLLFPIAQEPGNVNPDPLSTTVWVPLVALLPGVSKSVSAEICIADAALSNSKFVGQVRRADHQSATRQLDRFARHPKGTRYGCR